MKREEGGMKGIEDKYSTEDWREGGNDSYTPRLRRIDGESQISWIGTGYNKGWLRQNRSEQWLKNGDLLTL